MLSNVHTSPVQVKVRFLISQSFCLYLFHIISGRRFCNLNESSSESRAAESHRLMPFVHIETIGYSLNTMICIEPATLAAALKATTS